MVCFLWIQSFLSEVVVNVRGFHYSMSYVSINFFFTLFQFYDSSLLVHEISMLSNILLSFWVSDCFWDMHIPDLNATKPWRETGLTMMNFASGVNTGKPPFPSLEL